MSVSHIFIFWFLSLYSVRASGPCENGWGVTASGTCHICQPGFFDDGRGHCSPCSPDKFQPQPGKTDCHYCAPNTHSTSAATKCMSCSEGYILLQNNTCGACPAGFYNDRVIGGPFGRCVECQRGFFKAEEGYGPCLPCPRNTFSDKAASQCVSCPAQQALMDDGSCRSCPPGSYYHKEGLRCYECQEGSYTDSPNSLHRCRRCEGNSFAARGSSKCYECPTGQVYIQSSHTCGICHPGQFYNRRSLSCDPCQYNHFSLYENEVFCRECSRTSFARQGSTTCFSCPIQLVYMANSDGCGECSEEEFYDRLSARCVPIAWYH